MAMSTMLSPPYNTHFRPLRQAGGGDATSEVPVQQLYLSHEIQQRLRLVFSNLCGPNSTLSRQRFEEWLSTVQVQGIESLDKENYIFEEFLAAVYYNYGFETMKESRAEEKDLSKPISNYYISSSHNTYLLGNQLSSKSSTESYKNVSHVTCRNSSIGH